MAPFLAEHHALIPTKDLLSWYFDEPRFDQDRPVYIDAANTSRFWTANQCREAIRKLTAGFRKVGLRAQETVCIHSFNSFDYPVLVNGIIGFGGIFTGSSPGSTVHELVHHLSTADVKCAIVEPETLDTFLKAATEVGLSRDRIFVFSKESSHGLQSLTSLLAGPGEEWQRIDSLETAKATTAALLFSSGTTGLPKAAMMSHHNFIAQCTLLGKSKGSSWQKRRLVALLMFHVATVPTRHFNPLYNGDTMFISRRFEIGSYLDNIKKHQITDISLVPPIIHQILHSDLPSKDLLDSVRNANSGAAPLDAATQARFQQLLPPGTPLTQVWGMTETTSTCCVMPYPETDNTGSVGRMVPSLDIKLCNDNGEDITADDVRGELCIRGPVVFQGYFRNPKANKHDFDDDNFFHTDRNGKTKNWYIVDRKKELIKVRAFQVAPSEIEGVLNSHPRISEAAVVAVPVQGDTNGNEEPRAYVVGPGLTEDEVAAFLNQLLARYKQCTGGIVFVDQIPKAASGKILKKVLHERAKKERTLGNSKL